MFLSVILSTFDAPGPLELALWGYANQRMRDFDVVIADDGSGPATRDRIGRARKATGLAISHVWQADDGFRKCRILNRAIVEARGEYLLFSDGDCIPREDFTRAHARLARPGRFVSGGRVSLVREMSDETSRETVLSGELFDPAWIRARRGFLRKRDRLKLARSSAWAAALDRLTTTGATWNGHNASGWKADLLKANGFDERMKYPGEDRELGQRLRNAGIRSVQARHRAVCVHIDHPRPWAGIGDTALNEKLRAESRGPSRIARLFSGSAGGPVRTEHGIRKTGA